MAAPATPAQREERRSRVAASLVAGLTLRQIAQGLKCSVSTVHGDVKALLKQWREDALQDTDAMIQLELQRYDRALSAIWQQVLAGDLLALDRFLKISEARRKLLGLDKPTKTTVTVNALDQLLELLPEDVAQQVLQMLAAPEGDGA